MMAIDIFLDLDETVVFEDRSPEAEFKKICYSQYSMYPGGREFLVVLQQLGARISFYSAGSKLRNTELVAAIASKHFGEPDHRLEYQLFVGGDDQAVRRKKLQGTYPGLNLEQAIMLDDSSHLFSVGGEERNFLNIIPHLCRGGDRDPAVKRHYSVIESNRLVRALGMILWAVHLSRLTGWTPVEALSVMQWHGGNDYRHRETHERSFYELGL